MVGGLFNSYWNPGPVLRLLPTAEFDPDIRCFLFFFNMIYDMSENTCFLSSCWEPDLRNEEIYLVSEDFVIFIFSCMSGLPKLSTSFAILSIFKLACWANASTLMFCLDALSTLLSLLMASKSSDTTASIL